MRLNSLLAATVGAIAIGFSSLAGAQGAGGWAVEELDAGSVPKEIVPEVRTAAPNGLPDGLIAKAGGGRGAREAYYNLPTQRYRHGILGDIIEGGGLVVRNATGGTFRYHLPRDLVFEDRAPRIVDLDGDGANEVITITSSVSRGAAISIFRINGNTLEEITRSKPIGQPNRWLNIAGIDHYTGNRTPEIALVVTPHIGGKLVLYKFAAGRLIRFAAANGFSNHEIGSREQRLSASFAVGNSRRKALALPSANRKTLRVMEMGSSGFTQKAAIKLDSPIDKAIAVSGTGDSVAFTLGLANGKVVRVSR